MKNASAQHTTSKGGTKRASTSLYQSTFSSHEKGNKSNMEIVSLSMLLNVNRQKHLKPQPLNQVCLNMNFLSDQSAEPVFKSTSCPVEVVLGDSVRAHRFLIKGYCIHISINI